MIPRYIRPPMGRIWTDENRFSKWLEVELTVCEVLSELGVVPAKELAEIKEKAGFSVERILEIEAETHHDVTAFLASVSEKIGPASRYVHYGLTSSDVVDTALALLMGEAIELLIADVREVLDVLRGQAIDYRDTLMTGRTHGVHAEPTTFGLKLLVWYFEMKRNLGRLEAARDTISVGKISGAVGNYTNLDPEVERRVCERLGLRPAEASTQVLQRDRHAEYLGAVAIVGASLEKFATEIRHLQRTEVREVEEPFAAGQTGSSAMPHKRNPVICERITGLARLLRGYSSAALENMALWHERDISHSSVERVILPDATTALDYMIHKFLEVMRGLLVYPERMKENLGQTNGLIFSQRVLLALVEKGLDRRDAYRLVQRNAMKTWAERTEFKANLAADAEVAAALAADELDACFDIGYYLRNVDKLFARLEEE